MPLYGWPAALITGGIALSILAFIGLIILLVELAMRFEDRLPRFFFPILASVLFVVGFGVAGYFIGVGT